MRNANPIGFPMKKNLSIIGMRKAKGKNKVRICFLSMLSLLFANHPFSSCDSDHGN
jgi:hypothetical protein